MIDETRTVAPPTAPDDAPERLVMFLEPDQLVLDKSRPVPRATLSSRAKVALWALRVFVLVVTAMVIYTFFSQLSG
ncbi:MAG TPA: hypothetical protein VGY32_12405 [Solirubrobacteraceae bacterium]|jgi:hypothetical protein|nr:hypothetical protein [Solirubrobacteraceae bacterium]